jgi:hypothetical protein
MFRRVAYLAVVPLALALAGCGLNLFGGEQRAAWRDKEERACMRSEAVVPTAYVQPIRKIDGRGACGIAMPLRVSAFEDGTVSVGPVATLGCPMTAALESWLQESVQPAALAWFYAPVVEIKQISNYSCRPINNIHGEPLSEHAFGNALDIAAFTFADGRTITVKDDWQGSEEARGFLREVFAAGCYRFNTALGPGARFHDDHFHFDLAHRSRNDRYCKPMFAPPPALRPPYRGDVLASSPAEVAPRGDFGRMLDEAPPDVRRMTEDPFGVARSREEAPPVSLSSPPPRYQQRPLLPRADIPMSYAPGN